MRKFLLPALAAGLALAAAASADAQIVHINPAKGAIAQAVTVPAGSDTIYVSGITADPLDKAKPTELGDTKAQTISELGKIQDILKAQGYTLSDVVMMRVFLAGDPAKGNKMDFAGMMEGYTQFFGALENKPARATVQVAALVAPTLLVEIEVQAAKTPAKPAAKKK
jgi:enamine deaminase RidA (YjgF/YER057c/UK114 family)